MTPATPRTLTVSPAFTAQLRIVAERDALRELLTALLVEHDVMLPNCTLARKVRAALASDAGRSVGALDVERLARALVSVTKASWPSEPRESLLEWRLRTAIAIAAAYEGKKP